jgi:hypothetical protein
VELIVFAVLALSIIAIPFVADLCGSSSRATEPHRHPRERGSAGKAN